ncbi:hypothetical protein HRbin09_00187 [bacterium HR09]|nr:hypothetical protein HRbin09_00187 [bacterium HR09]
MGFDWNEFLALASYLAGETGTRYSQEAAKRTSVSRAYFATFCYARNYATSNQGFNPAQRAIDHKHLREHFKKLGGIWAEIAEALEDLRKWRNQCDYDDVVNGLDRLVAEAISAAKTALTLCG